MGTVSIELSDEEVQRLAEMSAMVLTMLGAVAEDLPRAKVEAWQNLCVELLKAARCVPSVARQMEMPPDCGYWFFRRSYVDEAFYSDVLDEYRDSVFWEELVARISQQTLEEIEGREAVELMSEQERQARCSSFEKALWQEVSRYGISRLLFLMPPHES